MSTDGGIEVEPDSPVAVAVGAGLAAFAQGDVNGVDQAYLVAGERADPGDLRAALAVDHVAKLLSLGAVTLALRRCDQYLADQADQADQHRADQHRAGPEQLRLRLLRAEIHGQAGAHLVAADEAARIRAAPAGQPAALTDAEQGRLLRIEGLAAADRDDPAVAQERLDQARAAFVRAGLPAAVTAIEHDLRRIGVQHGERAAVRDVLAAPPPIAVADRLLLVSALTRELRYEEALRLVDVLLADAALDPALRVHVLGERVALLHLTRQEEAAAALLPELATAATTALDPAAAQEVLARSAPDGYESVTASARFDAALQKARLLIDQKILDDAEQLLTQLRPRARSAPQKAFWELARGELELGRHRRAGTPSDLDEAVSHLQQAVDLAAGPALLEIRIIALRTLGRALARRPGPAARQSAARCWATAHRLEEEVAGRQVSDDIRIGMLLATADEHDERIRAAAEAWAEHGVRAAPSLVVAMDAARGATILGSLEHAAADRTPLADVGDDGWRWLRTTTRRIPRSQVVWLIHATPDRLHHVLLGDGLLHRAEFPLSRRKLARAVTALTACWDPEVLEASVSGGEFDAALARIAGLLRIAEILPAVPTGITRTAFVAGGELAEVPFAALPIRIADGGILRLGERFAVSDLPGLSARTPLHRRSRRQLGTRALVVSPAGSELTSAAAPARGLVLAGAEATVAGLRAALRTGRYRQVRIDGHGQFDPDDPTRSWLQLAPAGEPGRVRPDLMQTLDLRTCGTLMLGACESGMAHRRGRDEAAGFVRAAMTAGAGAVVAARWVAEDSSAAAVLDRFQYHLRRLPRDVALQRAQREVSARGAGLDHPARWGCWTLYGDSGPQTRAGAIRRRLRPGREDDRAGGA